MEFVVKKTGPENSGFNIKVNIASGYVQVCSEAGAMLARAIKAKQLASGRCSIGICSGIGNFRGVLDCLFASAAAEGVSWEDLTVYQLDEALIASKTEQEADNVPDTDEGVLPDAQYVYGRAGGEDPGKAVRWRPLNASWLAKKFASVGVRPVLIDPGRNMRFEGECERLAAAAAETGGLDIVLLAQGPGGAVSYYRPEEDRGLFRGTLPEAPDLDEVGDCSARVLRPGYKILTGAEKCVLISVGADRALALRQLVMGKVTGKVPVTGLRKSSDLTVFATEKSASLLHVIPAAG